MWWNRSSRRLKFQLSLKMFLFRLEIFILNVVNCLKVGSEMNDVGGTVINRQVLLNNENFEAPAGN